MRLLERTRVDIAIAPRCVRADALGALLEDFSEERRTACGNAIPSNSGLRNSESGLYEARTMCLLLPLDAEIAVGDGVALDGGPIAWRCTGLKRWSAHQAAQLERIQ